MMPMQALLAMLLGELAEMEEKLAYYQSLLSSVNVDDSVSQLTNSSVLFHPAMAVENAIQATLPQLTF